MTPLLVALGLILPFVHAWELGTTAEALTELDSPFLSVFNASAFPPQHDLDASNNASEVLKIANDIVAAKPNDSLALIAYDAAVGDPASLGVAVLLANWTQSDGSNWTYATAASEQLDYLLNYAPRTGCFSVSIIFQIFSLPASTFTDTGAISHRADEIQLWADFIYMAPPFIAYYGALQGGDNGSSLLQVAYEQISLYRDVLRDDSGLWKHVELGSWQDNTLWATGNGWVAAGMLRVLETLNHSSASTDFSEQAANLTLWIHEILAAAWQHQAKNGTLLNALNDSTSFADSSGTALLASVTYRMAAYQNDTTMIPQADEAFQLVQKSIDEDGWLRNTVDPLTFNTPSAANSSSPEGQAFVLLLEAAYRNYHAASVVGGEDNPSSNTTDGNDDGDDDEDDDDGSFQRCRLVLRV
ncbi:hypothetical protein D9757_000293 [Collybiopsis confluens]|uniref:Uncharacterized protein n=1 Tax=Collybiopsis confluens TaxID=2823264 RepID=A0A8H5MH97_9AGAR|nr:hypothetical protein D9757_000293 [Collybiopsis confluens]